MQHFVRDERHTELRTRPRHTHECSAIQAAHSFCRINLDESVGDAGVHLFSTALRRLQSRFDDIGRRDEPCRGDASKRASDEHVVRPKAPVFRRGCDGSLCRSVGGEINGREWNVSQEARRCSAVQPRKLELLDNVQSSFSGWRNLACGPQHRLRLALHLQANFDHF